MELLRCMFWDLRKVLRCLVILFDSFWFFTARIDDIYDNNDKNDGKNDDDGHGFLKTRRLTLVLTLTPHLC